MNIVRLRGLGPTAIGVLAGLLLAQLPAGAPVRAAPRIITERAVGLPVDYAEPRLTVVQAVAPVPAPTPAPAVVALAAIATATPRPTMSGTQPPATVPPTPVPPAPTIPTPMSATQFARAVNARYVPLKSSPLRGASTVTKVPHGQIAGLLAITSSGTWYKAIYRGQVGYGRVSRLQTMHLVGRVLAGQYPRVIVVARAQQHLEVWDHSRLMLVSAITTGRPELRTPLGTTRVLRKTSPYLFQSPWAWPSIYWYPPGWADFAVLFRSGGFYFHDTRARPEFGYGIGTDVPHVDPDGVVRTGSRGCVNTPYWAVRSLYGWAQLNDPVFVLDR